ncbi:MAG: ABC transporter ATP-binding protein [Candidatus Cloacimonadaceae bacterium]|jgi:ATP-binding cassette subfamily B multidrug efflux pump|nr:ABC transporter ATP-binding protein/permease [Candidatus Cloacimonadota bacterium]MDD5625238.1 ABC transporter ATP-binding protein [Candidatus Cloacimonadota bacterium]
MMGGGHGGGKEIIASDEVKTKIFDRRLLGRLLHYLKPYLIGVIVSFLIVMVVSFAELVQPLIQQRAIDDYIVSDKNIAIFQDEESANSFLNKYSYLKLKKLTYENRHFIILKSADLNKINQKDILEFQNEGIISEEKVFLLVDKPENIRILNKYLKEDTNPQGGKEGFKGWFRVGDRQIAISRDQLNIVPKEDRFKLRNEAANQLIWLALAFLAISIIRFIAGYFQVVITTTFSQKAMNDLRHDAFAHLQRMPVKFFDVNPVGRLVTRVTNDIRAIDEMLASGVITIIQDIIMIIAIVILMLLLNWKLALVSFAILPMVVWVIVIFRKKTRPIYREVRKQLATVNATLDEHISGQKIIKLFNQYKRKREEFAKVNQNYYTASMKQMKLFAFFRPIIRVSSQIAVALLIWYGGGQILQNVITIGLLMAFTQYISKLFQPIDDFSEKFNVLQGSLAAAERIFDLMELEPEDYREHLKKGIRLQGEIEFKNVWLAYNPGEWVLKDISFKIEPGEKIALVGHTGSGKTSIVNLILGMYTYQKGQILLDGRPLESYAIEDIRRNIGIVQQDVFIFSGNIRDNIALNNNQLSKEQIIQVAKYVNADKFISKLPLGYDEPVMERGATLSTGQRQLIAFARVLAYDPAIFILDEATSNIDTETELLIQDALQKIMHNRTSIVIAHRLSTIQNSDRIIVLHKGVIVEEGNHFELLDKKGLYYDLYRLQYT